MHTESRPLVTQLLVKEANKLENLFDFDLSNSREKVKERIASEPMPHNIILPPAGYSERMPTIVDNTAKYYARMQAECDAVNLKEISDEHFRNLT